MSISVKLKNLGSLESFSSQTMHAGKSAEVNSSFHVSLTCVFRNGMNSNYLKLVTILDTDLQII